MCPVRARMCPASTQVERQTLVDSVANARRGVGREIAAKAVQGGIVSRFDGVNPESVACPTCGRGVGLPCARKAKKDDVVPLRVAIGDWCGASKRSHPARVTAAIKAKHPERVVAHPNATKETGR